MSQFHYKQKTISEVNSTDNRVSLMGNVIAVVSNSFVLDDGTGKIEIASENLVEKNKFVKVFCSVVDDKLKADAIQDLRGLDLTLFKKVKELYNSAGV